MKQVLGLVAAGLALGAGALVMAQPQSNPVYVDESPAANDTFVRAREHVGAGNLDEAVRVLQILLDEQADRVIATEKDRDLFVSVRAAVHERLLAEPGMLSRYRAMMAARAERLFQDGRVDEVERSLLLTSAGFDSALRIAQRQIEDARFEAARLTLEQLEKHPDRTGDKERGARAAKLSALLARYLDRREVRLIAERWAAEAQVAAGLLKPEAWPAGALAAGVSPLGPLPALNASGLIAKPLWSVTVNPNAAPPDPNALAPGVRAGAASIPPLAKDLLLIPTVEGDTVFINDGTVVSAWDRFTLAPRWSVSPGIADAPAQQGGVRGNRVRPDRFGYGFNPRFEDLGTVTVQGRTAVAATGRGGSSAPGTRDSDDRLHALDTLTGRVRWTVQIGAIDPLLADSGVRGPAIITEGTVVVAARKLQPERRLVSLAIAGVEAQTGALRWVRPIGSAGSLPFAPQSLGAEGMMLSDGVVYRADRLGVVGAIEAGTGRVRWVRRLPVDAAMNTEQVLSWQVSNPIVDGTSIVMLSPDGRRAVRLDSATGTLLGERDVAELGAPTARYLLRAGEYLAAVGEDRIGLTRIAAFEIDRATSTQPIQQPGIRGRVSVVGGRLLVPTVSGMTLFDPERPQTPAGTHTLDEPGQVLALESQLVVADDLRLHSYLRWEVAEAILQQRIKADPKDPAPAVTFVELAYRAEHPERLAEAVDAALASLRVAPAGEATDAARSRLLEALNDMTISALEPGAGTAPRGQSLPKIIEDKALLETLVARLGELASTPDERVAHVLATGRVREGQGDFAGASMEYQRVLEDPALTGATWRGPQLSVRADLEATRRMEGLVRQHGPGAYAAQEAKARAELAGFGAGATIEQLEGLVARFPLSSVTPAAWGKLAEALRAADKPQQATAALEAGLRAAQRIADAPPATVGELAGRLIVTLRERKQTAAAAGVLRTVRTRFPGLALTSAGAPLDADRIGVELADALAAAMRWARVGNVRAEGAQVIPGWSLMEPVLIESSPTVASLVPLRSDDAVSVWAAPTAAAGGAGGAESGDAITKVWSREIQEGYESHLLKLTGDAAYFLFVSSVDGYVERVGGSPPAERWRSPSFVKALGREGSRGMRRVPGVMADAMATPTDGLQDPRNILVAMDDRTLVIVQRAGRAVGIDLDTGEELWAATTQVNRVYDTQVAAGLLVIAGDQEERGQGGVVTDLRPAIQIIDARTGRSTQKFGEGVLGGGAGGGHVHWVRITDTGTLIAGLGNAVMCVDPTTAQVNWTITHADILPVAAAWVFGDELVLLGPDRRLWLANASTGRMSPRPLDIPRTHLDAARSIEAFPLSAIPGSGFGVATQQGLALFSAEGALTGLDGMGGSTAMVPPRPAEGRAVTIETVAEGRTNDGLMMFSMHALDTSGGAMAASRPVLLGARPLAMMLIDGRIAVTAGSVTIVLDAPAGNR